MPERLNVPSGWLTRPVEVELIGCGGTGSAMLDELFRMHSLLTRLDHPGLIVRAWDGDTVQPANVGRQRFWPADVGWNKAELLVSRFNSFGGTAWTSEARALDADACARLRPDILISCVDDPAVRVMIGRTGRKECRDPDCLWLDTGNDHDSGQVILGHWAGPEYVRDRLPNVLDLYPGLVKQRADQRASCSTEEAIGRQDFGINQRVAAEASGLLWRLMRHGSLERHGAFIYQAKGEVLPLLIGEQYWQSFAA
ncbi:MAG TPA: PRTRC system ThiF family protein [Xanthomonadaceae bacterium]|nr:PRTRC system ThiF family protein [Xanthomonadaceae bacterium]